MQQCHQPDTPDPHLAQRLDRCTAAPRPRQKAGLGGASQRLTGQEKPQAEVVAQGRTRNVQGASTMSIAKLHTSPRLLHTSTSSRSFGPSVSSPGHAPCGDAERSRSAKSRATANPTLAPSPV